jgi:hypothetical protein
MTQICLFVSADFESQTILEEVFRDKNFNYLAYMSRGCAADACIKAFAMNIGINSCPFTCSSYEQLTGMGHIFDKCIVIKREDDFTLEKLSSMLAMVFRQVEIVGYRAHVELVRKRKLSVIIEE